MKPSIYLTRHRTPEGPRWAANGHWLPRHVTLSMLLQCPAEQLLTLLPALVLSETAEGELLAPVDPTQEIWAAGVTYLRSRSAREAESVVADVYQRVYEADRPELFFKALGWRAVGPGMPIRVRRDSPWNVPEPELTLVINRYREIVGYTVGNDVSSRSIEGENPLYLPQAKIYRGSCAVGPGIRITPPDTFRNLEIRLAVYRNGSMVYEGTTRTSQMKRSFEDLVRYLTQELDFPDGVLLMTGTGIVPPDDFTLQVGDVVRIYAGDLVLENPVGP